MDAPQSIELERHLDLHGRAHDLTARRVVLAVLALIPLLALADVFGQRPSTDTAASAAARLEVEAPTRLRGGLLYMGRFTIVARQDLVRPRLVLGPGWFEGMQVNTVTPAPTEESSRGGTIVYHYDDLRAGERMVIYVELQVNPTNVGRRSQSVALEAAGEPTLAVHRTVTIFP